MSARESNLYQRVEQPVDSTHARVHENEYFSIETYESVYGWTGRDAGSLYHYLDEAIEEMYRLPQLKVRVVHHTSTFTSTPVAYTTRKDESVDESQ